MIRDEIDSLKDQIADMKQIASELDMRQSLVETRVALLDENVDGIRSVIAERPIIPEKSNEPQTPIGENREIVLSDEEEGNFSNSDEETYDRIFEELDKLSPALVYKRGYDYVIIGNYLRAVSVFKYFIDKYPTHALTDNAHYWMGECYYAVKDYQSALIKFQKTIDLDGNKVSDALLKMGLTYASLGDREQALSTLKQVIEKFPNSWIEKLAKNKLEKIDKQ